MSFFNSIFGSSENSEAPKSKVNWTELKDILQLQEIEAISNEKPVVIFKHSTRCSISRMALKQFERELKRNWKRIEKEFKQIEKELKTNWKRIEKDLKKKWKRIEKEFVKELN